MDNSDDEDDLIHDGKRRGSNVSLSRFRSCPQLLDELNTQHPQRFEQTTDDSCTYVLKPALIHRYNYHLWFVHNFFMN